MNRAIFNRHSFYQIFCPKIKLKKIHIHIASVMEFNTVFGCRLYFCVLIKKWLHWRDNFFDDEFIPVKKSVMDSYSGSNLQYF